MTGDILVDVSRFFALALLAIWPASAQTPARQEKEQEKQQKQVEPPEEDENLKPREYSLNPIQAEKELSTGNFYFKKGNFKAAARRYMEATRWNPGWAEAYLKLGQASERSKDREEARRAYRKYLELAPEAKNAGEIRKKIGKT